MIKTEMAKKIYLTNAVLSSVFGGLLLVGCAESAEPIVLPHPLDLMSVPLPKSPPSVRLRVQGRTIVNSGGGIKKLRGLYTRAEWLSCEQEVEMFRDWGVNFVRILLTHDPDYWRTVNNGVKDTAKRGILTEEILRHMDQRVAWLEKNKIYFMMEIHWRALGADDNLLKPDLLAGQFAEMYKLLATRYSGSNYLMGFCTFSEIHLSPFRYNDYNRIRKLIVDAVHEIDHRYIVSLTGTWWSSPGSLKDKIYINRPNTIYDFHFYEPRKLTHYREKYGDLKYPGRVPVGWFNLRRHVDSTYLLRQIKPAIDFSTKWNVPIWCGEFGAFNNPPHQSDKRWERDVISIFEENNIPWIMWRWNLVLADVSDEWKRYWKGAIME